MENKDKTVITADTLPEQPERKTPTPTSEHRPSESYYKEMARYHAGFNSNYITPSDSLDTLYNRTCRLNSLFKALNRPWVSGSGEIQKACAYYLSHAELSKKSRETFIHVLGDIAYSICHLSACSDFIAQMQRYYRNQEKELRLLRDEQKEIEQRRKERLDRINEGEVAYCVTIGDSEIYGVTYNQLEELHQTIGIFIEREKAPFDCKIKGYEEYGVSISKSIDLCAGANCFHVDYSLSTFESDLCCMSAGQMKKVADTIQMFLKTYGENGDRKVSWDINDYPENKSGKIPFCIKEDSRKPDFKAVPCVFKCINQDDDTDTEISYDIFINEMRSESVPFRELIVLYCKLGDFLKKPDIVQ